MIDLFVKPDDEIIIKFAVGLDKNGKLFADLNKDILQKSNYKNIEEYIVIFKRPTFKDTVALSREFSSDGTNFKINMVEDRYKRVVVLIKSWNLKDGEGNPLEPNEKNISSLNPIIANIITDQLNLELGDILV